MFYVQINDKEIQKRLPHLNGLIFVQWAEGIGPGLHQFQHLLTHILMWRLFQETAEHFAVLFGEDLLVHWCSAVLDNTFQHKQRIACRVRIGWVHFLFDSKKGIFRSAGKWLLKRGKGNPIGETYVTSFWLISSQIRRIDGQSGSKRKWLVAFSVEITNYSLLLILTTF